jgi:hypothetical protein
MDPTDNQGQGHDLISSSLIIKAESGNGQSIGEFNE